VVFSNKNGLKNRALYWAIGSFTATAVIGFLVWLNYGWLVWNMPLWRSRVEVVAIHTLGDAWEQQSRRLSGSRAIDCGRVRVRGNPKAATECALKAFHEGKPFRVRYDLQGIDSDVSAGLVYTPDGKLYGLAFDGDPYGHGGTSWSRQRADKVPCPLPFQMYINPNGRLNCFTPRAAQPHGTKAVISVTFSTYGQRTFNNLRTNVAVEIPRKEFFNSHA
jgi:hypothetical protein